MKKLTLVSLCALVFTSLASAYVENGVYIGLTDDQKACQMTIVRQYYIDNVRHPLNERVVVMLDGQELTIAHPPIINSTDGTVSFNHDLFQGAYPSNGGASAFEVEISHKEGQSAPVAFHVMAHFWSTGVKTVSHCRGLQRQR